MAIQTAYLDGMASAYVGMIADTGPNNLISREVEAADPGIGFGVPVIQGTGDMQCDAVAAATDQVVGLTVRDQSVEGDTFANKDSALLMISGPLWVEASGAVSAGDDVWVTVATGALSAADVGSSGGLQLPGCRWESSATDGNLAKIRVDLGVPAVAGA